MRVATLSTLEKRTTSIASDHEHRRFSDAASLPRIINVPLFHEATFGIAQNWKWEPQFVPQRLGPLRRIDGNGCNLRPSGADLFVVVAVIRQLAKAERSPISAIENQHQRIPREKLRKPPELF